MRSPGAIKLFGAAQITGVEEPLLPLQRLVSGEVRLKQTVNRDFDVRHVGIVGKAPSPGEPEEICSCGNFSFFSASLENGAVWLDKNDIHRLGAEKIVTRFLDRAVAPRIGRPDFYPSPGSGVESAALLENLELLCRGAVNSLGIGAGVPAGRQVTFDLRQNISEGRMQNGVEEKGIGEVIRHRKDR